MLHMEPFPNVQGLTYIPEHVHTLHIVHVYLYKPYIPYIYCMNSSIHQDVHISFQIYKYDPFIHTTSQSSQSVTRVAGFNFCHIDLIYPASTNAANDA